MIVMDVKGGSWVGGIFQSFEAMCVGVEEAIYEDPFKYVEDQVLNVGESMKKFYSGVIQELIPPPLDSIKSEDPPSTVGHDAEAINIENKSSCSTIFTVIKPHKPMSTYSAEEKDAEENSLRQVTDFDLSDRATFKREDLEHMKDSRDSLSNLPSVAENMTNNYDEVGLEPCSTSERLSWVNEDAGSKEVPVVSCTEEDGSGICMDLKKCDGDGALINRKIIRVMSGRDMKVDLDGQFSNDLGLTSKKADLNTMITSDEENTIQVDKELSVSDIEKSNSLPDPELRLYEANDEGFLVEQTNKVNLEESCVLVGKNGILSKSSRQMQRSYKKKIQDVFSPRLWSKGKRNQEQLATWYEQQVEKKLVSSTLMLQNSQTSESLESDWELL